MRDGKGGSEEMIVFGLVILLLVLMMGYPFYEPYLIALWRYLRIVELFLFSWIPDWVPLYGQLGIDAALRGLLQTPAERIAAETVTRIDAHFAKYFSWVPGLLVIWLGIDRIKHNQQINTRHDMEHLLQHSAHGYDFLRDALDVHPERLDVDLDRNDPESLRWASAIAPKDFATMSPPLGLETEARRDTSMRAPIWDGSSSDVDLDLAERAFAAQLGAHYAGIERLTATEKTIYDLLVKKVELPEREMLDLVRRHAHFHVARRLRLKFPDTLEPVDENDILGAERSIYEAVIAWLESKPVLRKASAKGAAAAVRVDARKRLLMDRELKNFMREPRIKAIGGHLLAQRILSRHGFTRTGLMSLLERARRSGVVAPVEFTWVKGKDRVLWYCLHSVGRKTPFVEGGGAYAHWELEKLLGRPLTRPEVQSAVEALVSALRLRPATDGAVTDFGM